MKKERISFGSTSTIIRTSVVPSHDEHILNLAKKYTTVGMGIEGNLSKILLDCHQIAEAYLELLARQELQAVLDAPNEFKEKHTSVSTFVEPSFMCDEKLGDRCKKQCDVCAIAEGTKKL